MKKFAYCCKNDKSREKICVYTCSTIEDAVVYFANKKNLDIDNFIKLFEVFED